MHPAAMLRERLHTASRPARLPLPDPYRAREVATGEQTSIAAPGGPLVPAGADSDRPDGIEGLRKDTLTHHGPGQSRILHLDPLQVRPTNGEPGEVQAAQVAT